MYNFLNFADLLQSFAESRRKKNLKIKKSKKIFIQEKDTFSVKKQTKMSNHNPPCFLLLCHNQDLEDCLKHKLKKAMTVETSLSIRQFRNES
ncbi:hypothetical protein BpHYR1_027923 [Brachionus plicatilis]|uniref:Uncharacterized protein n=1 Tax=Brachionus plicatilis TaxID=10195 RepID=A0A3M7T8T4_BRAPC|nr:hypothetical protein BpHYR1_027923 [Brachionus plicatilis]